MSRSEIVAKHLRCEASLNLPLHFCFRQRKLLTSVLNPPLCLFFLVLRVSAILLSLILFFESFDDSSKRVFIDMHFFNFYFPSWFVGLAGQILIDFIKDGHGLG